MMTLIYYLGKDKVQKKFEEDEEKAMVALCMLVDLIDITLGYYLHMFFS
jgi:hypothetical protein